MRAKFLEKSSREMIDHELKNTCTNISSEQPNKMLIIIGANFVEFTSFGEEEAVAF